jgi:hypothetical protein
LKKNKREGFTYFVQSDEGGPVKIGFSVKPIERLKGLQTGSPVKLKILGLINEDQEDKLHNKFHNFRLHGEWFIPSQEIKDFINNKCMKDLDSLIKDNPKIDFEHKVITPINKNVAYLGKNIKDPGVYFDHVFENSYDLWEKVSLLEDYWYCEDFSKEAYEDEEILAEEVGDRTENPICEYDVIENICYYVLYNDFIEQILINSEEGYFCFKCRHCSSKKNWDIVSRLASEVYDMDEFTGAWTFFVMFEEKNKLIGIDLFTLEHNKMINSMNSQRGDGEVIIEPWNYIFDPSKLLTKSYEQNIASS